MAFRRVMRRDFGENRMQNSGHFVESDNAGSLLIKAFRATNVIETRDENAWPRAGGMVIL